MQIQSYWMSMARPLSWSPGKDSRIIIWKISFILVSYQVHESVCVHPHRSGGELMDYLLNMDGNHQEEKKLYATLFDLLSFEKIAFSGKYIYIYNQLTKAFECSLNSFFTMCINYFLKIYCRCSTETIPDWRVHSQIVLWNEPFLRLQSSVGDQSSYQ